jgi:hypothetical protein
MIHNIQIVNVCYVKHDGVMIIYLMIEKMDEQKKLQKKKQRRIKVAKFKKISEKQRQQ